MKSTPWVEVSDSYICSSFTWAQPDDMNQGCLVYEDEEARVRATPVSLDWYKTLRNHANRSEPSVFDTYICAAVSHWEDTDHTLYETVTGSALPSGIRASAARLLFGSQLYDYIDRPTDEQQIIALGALALSRQYRSTVDPTSDDFSRREAAVSVARNHSEDPSSVNNGITLLMDDAYLTEDISRTITQLDGRMHLTTLPQRQEMYKNGVAGDEE